MNNTASANIVWLTIDSVRQDHTSFISERDTTPNLKRLSEASDGQAFYNCISHAFATRTSTASILTGMYPSTHGVSTTAGTALSNSFRTIPGLLSEAGYTTSGISTNAHFSSATNIDKGFDNFLWVNPKNLSEISIRTLIKYALNIRRHSIGLSTKFGAHLPEFIVNDISKRKIDQLVSELSPFFFYAHYNGPHSPYFPPLPYMDEFIDEINLSLEEALEVAHYRHYKKGVPRLEGTGLDELTEEEYEALLAVYDAKLLYTDEMIGRMVEYVRQKTDRKTIIVVTADHGELIGEKGMVGHGRYPLDGLVRIPLVVHGFDMDMSDDVLIQHGDVMRSLLNHISVETGHMDCIDLRNTEREYTVTIDFDPDVISLRTDEFKYVDGVDGEKLYELPDETQDVSSEYPSKFSWFRKEATQYPQSLSGVDASLNTEMEQQLRDLGYL